MSLVAASGVPVIMHNAKHDMHALEVCGYEMPDWGNIHDTAILHRLHRSDLSAALKSKHTADLIDDTRLTFAGRNALDDRAKELGMKVDDKWQWLPVDDPMYWAYGVMDTVLTRRVFDAHAQTIADFGPAYEREMRYQAIMYRAEVRGLYINESYCKQKQVEMAEGIEKSLFFLQSNGLDNPNSNDQVIALLETDYGFVPWEFTESGQPSVNKDVLKVLAQAGGLQEKVIAELVNYKRLVKWKATYIDRFLTARDHLGVVHPSIHTMEARTGRSSVTNPAVQTAPKSDPIARNAVKAARGYQIVSIDYNSQEPRLLCHFGGSEPLMDFILNGDGKIHDWVARNLYGEGYTKTQRGGAKAMGLGRSYGAGPPKMAQSAGLPLEEILPLVDPYDELMGLKGLKKDMDRIAADRQPTPYVVTSGGRRAYADVGREFTLVNYLMQGSGADVLKEATVRLDYAGLSDFIMMPVHDELVFSFPTEEAEGMTKEACDLMEDHNFRVPLTVGASAPASTWGAIEDD